MSMKINISAITRPLFSPEKWPELNLRDMMYATDPPRPEKKNEMHYGRNISWRRFSDKTLKKLNSIKNIFFFNQCNHLHFILLNIKLYFLLLPIIMLSVNFFSNISSYDILAYITKNYIALIYYAKIVHLLCQFHAGKVGFQLSVKLYIASPRARGRIQSVNLS